MRPKVGHHHPFRDRQEQLPPENKTEEELMTVKDMAEE
jgi:hypothetical protein